MKMQININVWVIFIIILGFLPSCSTSEKFYVNGTPGTIIYNPSKVAIGEVDANGKAKIEISSDNYYAYLFTYDEQSDIWVPFALETKENKHRGAGVLKGLGGTFAYPSDAGILVGGIMAACGATEEGLIVLGASGGLAAISNTMMAVGAHRMNQTCYEYNFSYMKDQDANSDLTFTKYTPPSGPQREIKQKSTSEDFFAITKNQTSFFPYLDNGKYEVTSMVIGGKEVVPPVKCYVELKDRTIYLYVDNELFDKTEIISNFEKEDNGIMDLYYSTGLRNSESVEINFSRMNNSILIGIPNIGRVYILSPKRL